MSTKTDICGQLYGGTPEHLKVHDKQWATFGQATPTTPWGKLGPATQTFNPIWYPPKVVDELRARAEKAEAEVERLTELLRIESAASAHALLWAEKAEDDTLRLDWLLARNSFSTICSHSGGVSVTTYLDRDAIDTAMKKEASK